MIVGSNNSSPSEFAFDAPQHPDLASFNKMTFNTPGSVFAPNTYGFPANYSSGSSFSSTTGSSIDEGSFSSSADLPAISRDFARPSSNETRRPATAGGALPSGDRFQRLDNAAETIEENGFFQNPFTSPKNDKYVQAQEVDPRYASSARRASEGGPHAMLPPSWPAPSMQSMTSAPPPNSQQFSNLLQLQQAQRSAAAAASMSPSSNRPQTSDGLPTYSNLSANVALPSARSLVGQVNGFNNNAAYAGLSNAAQSGEKSIPGRDGRSASMSSANRPTFISKVPEAKSDLTFVTLGGPAPKKRPRRRYDEIERLYSCGWNGCEKAYGTLNHLNAHVAMQKHGEKRLPSEFKDMRKAWRKKKREAAAAAANAQYMANAGWNRNSMSGSSDSDFDRRNSSISMSGESSFYSGGYDSRPTTASSTASNDNHASVFPYHTQQQVAGMMSSMQPPVRRGSAPQHIPMPQTGLDAGFRYNEGDHPTPTPQNPFPFQAASTARNAFPFQTLTQPMTMQMAAPMGMPQAYGQFAFNR